MQIQREGFYEVNKNQANQREVITSMAKHLYVINFIYKLKGKMET